MGRIAKSRELKLGAAAMALLAFPAHANAQSTASPVASEPTPPPAANQAVASAEQPQPDMTTADIVVTAQRRKENLQDVPITVEAFQSDTLAAASITNTADLVNVIPGLTMPTSAGYTLPHLRGIGTTAIGPGIENSVALYVDGVYHGSSSSSALSLNNIAQLEVEKGPQGTLFGRNATGGLIQVTTVDPKPGFSGSADIGYGNYDTVTGNMYVTGGTDTLAGDLAVRVSHQGEGWGTNVATGQDVNQVPLDLSVRSKWLLKPADGTKVTLILDYERMNFSTSALQNYGTTPNAFYPGGFPVLGPYDVDANSQPERLMQEGGVSLQLDQDIGFASLVNTVAYRQDAYNYNVDFDLGPAPYSLNVANQTDKQFSEELQLVSKKQSALTWVVGVYYFHAVNGFDPQIISFSGPAVNPAFPLTQINNDSAQTTNSLAVYAQTTLQLSSNTKLTGGLRYTYERRSLDGLESGTLNGVVPVQLANLQTSTVTQTPTWRIALNHDFSDNVHGYISYNRGFKSGGYNVTAPTLAPYLPEKLDAYEIGLKTQFFDRRLTVNTAFFYYDYTNIQVSRFINGSPEVYNGGRAKLYGLDVDVTARITNRFTLSGGVELEHSEFTSFPNSDYFFSCATPYPTVCSLSAVGNQLPQTPTASETINADYRLPLTKGELNFNFNADLSSGYYFTPSNELRQGPYGLLNGSIRWTDGKYTFSIWGKNLTNNILPISENPAPTALAVAYGAPRTFGFTVGTKF